MCGRSVAKAVKVDRSYNARVQGSPSSIEDEGGDRDGPGDHLLAHHRFKEHPLALSKVEMFLIVRKEGGNAFNLGQQCKIEAQNMQGKYLSVLPPSIEEESRQAALSDD